MRLRLCGFFQILIQLEADELSGIAIYVRDDPTHAVRVGLDNLLMLVDQLLARSDDFSGFNGRSVRAKIDYLGVANSLVVDIAADAKSAEVYIPATGLRVSFDATSTVLLQQEGGVLFSRGGRPRNFWISQRNQ